MLKVSWANLYFVQDIKVNKETRNIDTAFTIIISQMVFCHFAFSTQINDRRRAKLV